MTGRATMTGNATMTRRVTGCEKKWPQKKGFWPFSLVGWFYMDRNNAVWSGHIVAPLWIPHLPIFEKIDPRPPGRWPLGGPFSGHRAGFWPKNPFFAIGPGFRQWPVCSPPRYLRFGTFGSIFKLFVSELRTKMAQNGHFWEWAD